MWAGAASHEFRLQQHSRFCCSFENQVFVDKFFRETQLPGISHLPTAPMKGFLNAAEPPCRACRHQPEADARSCASKRLRHEASVSWDIHNNVMTWPRNYRLTRLSASYPQ